MTALEQGVERPLFPPRSSTRAARCASCSSWSRRNERALRPRARRDLLAACGGEADKPRAQSAAEEAKPALGVALNEEERGKLGVELGDVTPATFQPTLDGPARVLDAQNVVAAMAELGKARPRRARARRR